MQFPVIVYRDEDGVYIAECPLLPGFHTYGKTRSALDKNVDEVTALYAEMIQAGEYRIPLKLR